MLPSASFDSVGTPNSMISRLDGWPVRTPVQRFACVLADADAGLGAIVDRYSFDVERSHLLLHAGLSRRSKRARTPIRFSYTDPDYFTGDSASFHTCAALTRHTDPRNPAPFSQQSIGRDSPMPTHTAWL